MTIQTINLGNYANDGTGDDLRVAFTKVNENFAALDASAAIANGVNVGTGVGIFFAKDTTNLQFKSLTSTNSSVTISSTGNTVDLAAVTRLQSDLTPTLGANLNLNNHYVYGGDIQSTVYGYNVPVSAMVNSLLIESNSLAVDMGSFLTPTGYETDRLAGKKGYLLDWGLFSDTPINDKLNFGSFSDHLTGGIGQLTLAGNLVTTGAYNLTLATTGNTSLTLPTSGTLTTTANNLSAFAATTSAQLLSVISDETGTGKLVFATNPVLVAPTIGAATATSITFPNTTVQITAYPGDTTFHGYDYEIHVSGIDGNDTTGDGNLLKPVATITKALTLVTAGLRRTIVIHPGTYAESPSITVQSTCLNTFSPLGGTTYITGTLSTSVGCTIAGMQIANLNITTPSGVGDPHIIDCTITGTLTKSGSATYTEIQHCDINTACNITGAGLVNIVNPNLNFLTVNNAGATVTVRAAKSCKAPVLTAGVLNIVDSAVQASVTNALTSAVNSILTLANSQFLNSASNNVAPLVLNGFYSILNCVYDKPNSTLVALSGTGGSLSSIDYFQYINADRLITSNTSFDLLNTTATTVNAFGAATTIAIGVAGGTTTIAGRTTTTNLSRSGLEIAVPNYITVSTTTTYALSTTVTENILLVTAGALTATLTFPSASLIDGQRLSFTVTTNTVTLALTAGPTLVGTFAGSVTAPTTFTYVYRTSNTTWYRI
jgi:hypothetical protein